ncbi:MAG: hypothetical protein M3P27_13465 [Acidobacteriota bacterium]|nr:hypothetical protein [Acidobacteriota bacterium]
MTNAEKHRERARKDLALIREWRGELCRCGRPKKPKYTLCTSCYFMLPPKLRTRQAARIDDPDFCTAFRDALVWLGALGRFKKQTLKENVNGD